MSGKLLARLMFIGTLLLFGFGLQSVTRDIILGSAPHDAAYVLKFVIFATSVLCLFYGNAVYQLTRIGQMKRHDAFVEPSRGELEAVYDDPAAPTVAILIPCYKEELSVIMQTVLSAAFAEYPDRRITLLIDDPPSVAGADLAALAATRELVKSLDTYFKTAADLFTQHAKAFEKTVAAGAFSPVDETAHLAELYAFAASLVDDLDADYRAVSSASFAHSDELFHREVLSRVSDAHRARMASLGTLDEAGARKEYRRLACLFSVPIGSFERKTFANLSHAPNKAMNLNSYISLIGKRFVSRPSADGLMRLELAADGHSASFEAPAAKYILTIDADSLILPDYLLKLVGVMERDPGLAVAQTPYSAYRNPPSVLERTAGATTDIQYFVHQGFGALDATFWVGANALLRYDALKEIACTREEGGPAVTVYIQDETLIEDTGSTIDLVARGWRLHNYPQRLAYSATPPDFGALVIQRTRWANGGLIIFPILFRLLFGISGKRVSLKAFFVRTHYLLSPALANLSLMVLLVVPFGPEYAHPCLILAACPYYLFYGLDLRRAGYHWKDLWRHYALTLLLIPVNLTGVFFSCSQLVTGRKMHFKRTPKISGRTPTPVGHIAFLYLLAFAAGASAVFNLVQHNFLFFFFCSINAAFLIYAQICLIGVRAACEDVWFATKALVSEQKPEAAPNMRLGSVTGS